MHRVRRWMADARAERVAHQMDQYLSREDPSDSPAAATVEHSVEAKTASTAVEDSVEAKQEQTNEELLKKIEEQRVEYDLLKGLHTRSMKAGTDANNALAQTVEQQRLENDLLKKKLSVAEKSWQSAQTALNDRAALQRTQVQCLQQRLQNVEQLLASGVHQMDEDWSLRMQLNNLEEMLVVFYRNFDSLRSENSNLKEGMQNMEKEKMDMANKMIGEIDQLNQQLFVLSFKNKITEKKLSDVVTALEESKKDVFFWTQKYREASRAPRFLEFPPGLQVIPVVQSPSATFVPHMTGHMHPPFVPPFFMPGMFPSPSTNGFPFRF